MLERESHTMTLQSQSLKVGLAMFFSHGQPDVRQAAKRRQQELLKEAWRRGLGADQNGAARQPRARIPIGGG